MTDGTTRRDRALERVRAGSREFYEQAIRVILAYPVGRRFTADDLWAQLPPPPEPRALGPPLRTLSLNGHIAKTGIYRESQRKGAHARPIPVWERRGRGGIDETRND